MRRTQHPAPTRRRRRQTAAGLLSVVAGLVGLPALAAGAADPVTTNYDFETSAQGWTGQGVMVARDTTRAAHGLASLRLTGKVSGKGVPVTLRAVDGVTAARDLSALGDTLSVWAHLPAGTPGHGWSARLDVQDGASIRTGPSVALAAGGWVQLTHRMSAELASRAGRIAVQFDGQGVRGTVTVNVDTVRQSGAVATAPSPSPTTPSPSPTAPSPSPTAPSPSPTAPSPSPTAPSPTPSAPAVPTGLRAVGSVIVDAAGRPVRLLGVTHAGPEYACSQGWGFFDGPNVEAVPSTFLAPMQDWRVRAVRVPLNEHCWLDLDSGIVASRRGAAYQRAITDYVAKINAAGMVAVLDLHWHAPGTRRTANNPMPNRDNSPRFWASVARHFKAHPAVVFELVNEPHPDGNRDTTEAWRCWRDGGTCAGVVDEATQQGYVAAGMQELVDAVRSTGADQLLLAGGVQYANRLSRWLEFRPRDPLANLGAAWHVYDFNACRTRTCYDAEVAPVAAAVPLVATEVGPDQACMTCSVSSTGFSGELLDWLDARRAGYQAWAWNRWATDPHMLTSDWNGTATTWGAQVRARFAAAAAG
jgi:hypothetical protein